MGLALLDSNTVIEFLDADDVLHQAADTTVRAVAAEHEFVVSVVTVEELRSIASGAQGLASSMAMQLVLDEPGGRYMTDVTNSAIAPANSSGS